MPTLSGRGPLSRGHLGHRLVLILPPKNHKYSKIILCPFLSRLDSGRVPEFTRRGSGCFTKCLGTRTLYLGQRGKPTRFLEGAKGSFAESRGQTPGTLASGPWTPQDFLLRFPKTLWAFPFGPNKVFSYTNISGNIRNPFRRPNTIIPYINLYLRTISEFLVMSVILSGTPNNIRLPTYITHKYYIVNKR